MPRVLRLLVVAATALLVLPALVASTSAAREPAVIEVDIVGRAIVGRPVTAIVAVDRPGTTSYQWTRAYTYSGTQIDFPGATRPTFTPTAYFRGKVLGLRVTHTSPSGETTHAIRLVGLVRPGTLPAVRVAVRGAVAPGRVLRAAATRPTAAPPGFAISFDWYAGHRPVRVDGRPATDRRLRLVPALVKQYAGHRLHVRVTTAAPGYRTATAVSKPTKRLQRG